ncbi:MAG: peroxidase-related enzyme [Bacteroidetes bacterium]|nr:peroxidase-related enzyme [Bacteroidota bacterium]
MPHIKVDPDLPGIRSLLAFSPEPATPMGKLANLLLRTNKGLSMPERELIGAYVSYLNDCFYCYHSHGALVTCYLNDNNRLIEQVRKDYNQADISEKMKALLSIAGSVQKDGKSVTEEQIIKARDDGASDKDIHDTVLIAAMFCMFNRYVDGLAANTPTGLSSYLKREKQIMEHGYGNYIFSTSQPE